MLTTVPRHTSIPTQNLRYEDAVGSTDKRILSYKFPYLRETSVISCHHLVQSTCFHHSLIITSSKLQAKLGATAGDIESE